MLIVFGSLNADMVFAVDRFPTPGETRLCDGYRLCAGGKGGNQAVAAARAGAKVKMVGALGRDSFAKVLRDSLQEAGVDIADLQEVEAPTACASIYVDRDAENMIMVASGANHKLRHSACDDVLLRAGNTLCLQMEVGPEETYQIAARAHASQCRVLLNLAPFRPITQKVMQTLDVLIVNEGEAKALSEHAGLTAQDDAGKSAQALARHGKCTVVITLGKRGALAASADEVIRVDAKKIKPVDTTGAGDCFVGVLGAMLDEGKTMRDALQHASAASALCCLKEGTQPSMPGRADIADMLARA